MTRPKVTPLHPEPATPIRRGAFGLHWTAERTPNTHRWAVVGRHPERTHGLAVVIEVRHRPGSVTAEEIARVFAQLANDMAEGAAALMAAALQQEEGTDG